MGLLSAYRVLGLCDEKGVVCSRILGDFGADVIKVGSPEGDPRNLNEWLRFHHQRITGSPFPVYLTCEIGRVTDNI
jgi:crotonobetainyl-CoA:carnitine CoA-transferase CaiB-like acyl-CoA transferase